MKIKPIFEKNSYIIMNKDASPTLRSFCIEVSVSGSMKNT